METIETPEFMSEVGPHYLFVSKNETRAFPLPTGENVTVHELEAVADEMISVLEQHVREGDMSWHVFYKDDDKVYDLTVDLAERIRDYLETEDAINKLSGMGK